MYGIRMGAPESSAAWRELLSAFADFDALFLEGAKAVRGEPAVAEGYQFLATMLGMAFDVNFFADPVAPRFADLLTPFRHDRRWGGDNTDAYYSYAVVDPRRTYRVSGAPNGSAMYSVAVYNEPEPGAWPNRTIGVLYDEQMPLDADGRFSRGAGSGATGRVRRPVHRAGRRRTRGADPRLSRRSPADAPRRLGDRGDRARRLRRAAAEK